MRFCLKLSLAAAFVCALAATETAVAGSLPARVRSVVKADARGRLVRKVVVTRPPAESAAKPAPAVKEIVNEAARKYDVDPLLVQSVIEVESGYDPYAVSPKGAQGLMQLMPGTARRFGVSNSFDPRENIEGGVRYLKYLSSLFPDDPDLAIAAYNAGEGAVWKYNSRIPPYRETQEYVQKVSKRYGKARKAAQDQDQMAQNSQVAKSEEPAGPVYAPVRYYLDAEGRLHMTTADPSDSGPTRTP